MKRCYCINWKYLNAICSLCNQWRSHTIPSSTPWTSICGRTLNRVKPVTTDTRLTGLLRFALLIIAETELLLLVQRQSLLTLSRATGKVLGQWQIDYRQHYTVSYLLIASCFSPAGNADQLSCQIKTWDNTNGFGNTKSCWHWDTSARVIANRICRSRTLPTIVKKMATNSSEISISTQIFRIDPDRQHDWKWFTHYDDIADQSLKSNSFTEQRQKSTFKIDVTCSCNGRHLVLR